MKAIRLGPHFTVPIQVVTETLGILAVKRAGKSNTAVVMAEEMYDAGLPWVAIDPKGDWWGIRAAGDGKAEGLSVLVFGGEHGDVPLEPTAGKLIADLVIEQRITCVLDVSEMTKADMRRFLIDFADRLYRKNREPLHVFCEEADEYIPQSSVRENAKLLSVFETLVKRGGFRGIGVTLITQRSASLNKDVLTQVGTLIAMRTPSPQDRKAIFAWIDYHDAGRDIVDELPTLANGTAWVISPEWLKDIKKVSFRRRRTFDSGATPEVGKKLRPPARLADVDLDAIREAMAETIEKQAKSDPKYLQRRVTSLEHSLQQANDMIRQWEEHKCEAVTKTVSVPMPVLEDKHVDSLQEAARVVHEALDMAQRLQTPVAQQKPISAGARERMNTSLHRTNETRPVPPARTREAVAGSGIDAVVDGAKVGKGEKKVLSVLAQHGQRTASQLAMQTGYSARASTISALLSQLRKKGLVEPTAPIRATPFGIEVITQIGYEPLPTGQALLSYWKQDVGKGGAAVLDHLISVYPHTTTHDETAAATGYSPDASTISAIMSKLRKLELADGWKLSDEFWEAIQ